MVSVLCADGGEENISQSHNSFSLSRPAGVASAAAGGPQALHYTGSSHSDCSGAGTSLYPTIPTLCLVPLTAMRASPTQVTTVKTDSCI